MIKLDYILVGLIAIFAYENISKLIKWLIKEMREPR